MIFLAGTAANLWMAMNPATRGLPRQRSLSPVSGQLAARHWGYRSYTIRMQLNDDPRTFIYTEKMGDKLSVWNSLCEGCLVTLWTDKGDRRSEPFVFQIAVRGRVVRSYRDVSDTWIAGNKITPYFAVIFLIGTLAASSYAFYQWHLLRKP
ncbi:MAG TPA: hypothetical protein VLC74_13110 [Rhizomicrobium sp.]|nr:hypothetical protein [Rhizomicrobium sp.]